MAAFEIPVNPDFADQEMIVRLSLRTFRIRLRFSVREAAWYMDLSTEEGTVIITGRKLVSDWSLLRNLVGTDRPSGDLVTTDTAGTGATAGRDELGPDRRVRLIYVEPE